MASAAENGHFATSRISKLLERLAFQINTTRHSHGPDPVHDLRVAIRRFAQALELFKPYLPGKKRKKIRRRLKELILYAGDVRDCDIALKLLARQRSNEVPALLDKIRERRKEAEAALVAALRRWVNSRSPSKWRAGLLPLKASEGEVTDGVGRLAKNFFEAGNHAASKGSASDLHKFRIEAKKFRYTLELVQPLYGDAAEGWIVKVKEIQTVLGDINDCRATRAMLDDLGADSHIGEVLKRRQQKKTAEFRDCWEDEYSRLSRTWIDDMKSPPAPPAPPVGGTAPAESEPAAAPRPRRRPSKSRTPTLKALAVAE
jgi:CHAD domain-containing protein